VQDLSRKSGILFCIKNMSELKVICNWWEMKKSRSVAFYLARCNHKKFFLIYFSFFISSYFFSNELNFVVVKSKFFIKIINLIMIIQLQLRVSKASSKWMKEAHQCQLKKTLICMKICLYKKIHIYYFKYFYKILIEVFI